MRALLISGTVMGKLKQLKPRGAQYIPRGISPAVRLRDQVDTWRRWYKTERWRQLSVAVKVEERFTCRMCGRVGQGTHDTVADHIKPHRGDRVKFWARGNLQCLCRACHDSEKQKIEMAEARRGVV